MSQPAHLRVILSDHYVQKLTLPSGVQLNQEQLKNFNQLFEIPMGFQFALQGC